MNPLQSVNGQNGAFPTGVSPQASPSPSADFSTFLVLLTAQLRNQDPLEPLDSTQFVAQLASFSAVEQQVKTNDNLAQIQHILAGADGASMAAWIGKEVRAQMDAYYDGDPVSVFIDGVDTAERVNLVVYDSQGNIVQSLEMPLGAGAADWNGEDADGNPLPEGYYTFRVESFINDEVVDSHQAQVYAQVSETRFENGAITLVFADGATLPASLVTALRRAQ